MRKRKDGGNNPAKYKLIIQRAIIHKDVSLVGLKEYDKYVEIDAAKNAKKPANTSVAKVKVWLPHNF